MASHSTMTPPLVRLTLAGLALMIVALTPKPATATDTFAGCSEQANSACAYDPGVTTGKACVSSSGCTTCTYTGISTDECFHSSTGSTHLANYIDLN